jgi:hypothetical protein
MICLNDKEEIGTIQKFSSWEILQLFYTPQKILGFEVLTVGGSEEFCLLGYNDV